MDPISLGMVAAVGMGATAAGGAVKTFGDILTGDAKSKQDAYQASIAEMNAAIAKQDANYAIASGEVEAQQAGYRTADEVARTRVGFAAGDIATNTGTASKVVSSEIAIGQQNQAIVRANAAKRAFGYSVASAEDEAQAGLFRSASKYDRTASYIGAASTVLGTVGQVSSQYIAGSKAGSGVFSS